MESLTRDQAEEGKKRNLERQQLLEKAGWKVYRFDYYDIDRLYKFEKSKEKILGILKNDNLRD